MSDLNELFKVAPGTAAFMTGQNQRQATEEKALKQQQLMQLIADLQQKHQQSADLHPYEVESKSLANIGEQAKIPGYAADSSLKGTTAAKAAGTLSSDIAAGISNNEETVSKNKSARQTRLGNVFYSMGPELEGQPAAVRAAYALEKLQGLGMKPDDPFGQRLTKYLQNTPAEELPAKLTAIGRRMIEESGKYKEEMDKQRLKEEGDTQRNNASLANQLTLEDKRIEAGKYAKNKVATDFQSQVQSWLQKAAGNIDAQYAILNRAEVIATQGGMPDLAANYAAQAAAIEPHVKAKIAASNAAKADLGAATKGRVPTMPAPSIAPPSLADSSPAAHPGDIQMQAKQAFGAYEPDKYEYGINPATKKFARKPKRTQ
jgi:hypothetical protein